jgi:hypothetical protein
MMLGKRAPALLELPGCAAVTAAKPLAEIGAVERFRSDVSSLVTPVSPRGKLGVVPSVTVSTAAATASSTRPCTASR